jgi:hypothetical protein
MINALNDLRRQWRARQEELRRRARTATTEDERLKAERESVVLDGCIRELLDTVDGIRPLPLNEASTRKLYNWAPRMITILDLMIEARDDRSKPYDSEQVAYIAAQLGELADQAFLNDIYDIFKHLANRGTS